VSPAGEKRNQGGGKGRKKRRVVNSPLGAEKNGIGEKGKAEQDEKKTKKKARAQAFLPFRSKKGRHETQQSLVKNRNEKEKIGVGDCPHPLPQPEQYRRSKRWVETHWLRGEGEKRGISA